MAETLLGSVNVLSDEERRSRDFDEGIAILIAEQSLIAYMEAELTFEGYVRLIVRAAKAAPFLPHHRQMFVGDWVVKAFKQTQKKRSRGNKGLPKWHRKMAVAGLAWAKEKGHSISRLRANEGKNTAFEAVAEYLTAHGLATTPAQVERCYREDVTGDAK